LSGLDETLLARIQSLIYYSGGKEGLILFSWAHGKIKIRDGTLYIGRELSLERIKKSIIDFYGDDRINGKSIYSAKSNLSMSQRIENDGNVGEDEVACIESPNLEDENQGLLIKEKEPKPEHVDESVEIEVINQVENISLEVTDSSNLSKHYQEDIENNSISKVHLANLEDPKDLFEKEAISKQEFFENSPENVISNDEISKFKNKLHVSEKMVPKTPSSPMPAKSLSTGSLPADIISATLQPGSLNANAQPFIPQAWRKIWYPIKSVKAWKFKTFVNRITRNNFEVMFPILKSAMKITTTAAFDFEYSGLFPPGEFASNFEKINFGAHEF
jgi:hypothetical protein